MSTCIGAWGLMSLKATSVSSSYTFVAGISPAMMRQNRQEVDMAALCGGHDDSRNALQVRANGHQPQAGLCDEGGDGVGLSRADFHHERRRRVSGPRAPAAAGRE